MKGMPMTIDAHRWLMKAVNAPLERVAFDAAPGPGEVAIAIAGCGVCHTDLGYLYDGVRTTHALPLALGHEISGRVVAAGAGADRWVGKAVIVPAVLPCGECDLCQRGLGTICRQQKMPGNDIQGGFASHIVVPARGLCEVDEARLAQAGLTLAEVSIVADALTTPYQAVRRAALPEDLDAAFDASRHAGQQPAAGRPGAGFAPGSLAIVIGVGGVGGYCVQVAHAFGASVVAIDVAKKNGLRSTEWFIFECSGSAPGQLTAYSLLVHGATLSVVGFTLEKVEVRLSNLMAFNARAIGNWGCPPEAYPAALELVLNGKVQIKPFVEIHPLADINRVFAAVHHRDIKKRAVLVPAFGGPVA